MKKTKADPRICNARLYFLFHKLMLFLYNEVKYEAKITNGFVYISLQGNMVQQIFSRHFILELLTTVPFLVTVFHPPLRNMFIPVFLNSWLAKYALQKLIYNNILTYKMCIFYSGTLWKTCSMTCIEPCNEISLPFLNN